MSRPPLVFRTTPDALDSTASTDPSVHAEGASPGGRATGRPGDVGIADATADTDLLAGRDALADAGLDVFASEEAPPAAPDLPPPPGRSPAIVAGLAVCGIVIAAALLYFVTGRSARSTAASAATAAATGQAQFESQPPGADVVIDGEVRGKTPLKLTLPVGSHALEIRGAAAARSLPLTIESDVLVSQYVELTAPVATAVGRLDVTSDPPGAQVSLDGVVKGVTPLKIEDVDARDHIVSLTRAGATVYRTVPVQAGATATVSVAMASATPAPGAVGGFLSFSLPFEAQVFEGGRMIGSTGAERLMVPTGRHEIELVNSALQFRTSVTVTVAPGRVTSPSIAIPDGTISINALPWADVFLDGRPVGTTPLANLAVPIGQHTVVWRHPQLGERQQTVTVTGQTPVRIGVNLGR